MVLVIFTLKMGRLITVLFSAKRLSKLAVTVDPEKSFSLNKVSYKIYLVIQKQPPNSRQELPLMFYAVRYK